MKEDEHFDLEENQANNPVLTEKQQKSYDQRFHDLLSWNIENSTDFIREKDLLKILQLTKGSEARIEILDRFKVPKRLYEGLEQVPMNKPLAWKNEVLKAMCESINGKTSLLKRAERAVLKNEFIERFKPKERESTPNEKDPQIFDDIANINPVHFLNKVLDFQPVPGKNGVDWIQRLEQKRANGIEIASPEGKKYLVVNAKDSGHFLLLSRDQSFKGGLLQFVMSEILGHSNIQDGTNKKEAIDFIRSHYSLGEKVSYNLKRAEKKEKDPTEMKAPVDKAFTKLEYPQYLFSRGITLKTLASPQFKGLIGNSFDRNHPSRRNITFKMKNLDGLFTYLEKNRGQIGLFQKGVTTGGMLFRSNEGKGGYDTLVFGETAIDLLSKIELDGGVNKKHFYVSTNGYVNEGQLEHIKSIIEDKGIQSVVINQDNDLMGRVFTNKILTAIYDLLPSEQQDDKILDVLEKNRESYLHLDKDLVEEKIQAIDSSNELLLSVIQQSDDLGVRVHIFTPKGKDFNEDLMNEKGISREDILTSIQDVFWEITKVTQEIKGGAEELDLVKEYVKLQSVEKEDEVSNDR